MEPLKTLKDLYAAVDSAFSRVQDEYPAAVQCGKGCDDCCHAVFDVSLVEAVALLHCFNSLSEQQRLEIVAASRVALGQWKELLGNRADIALGRIRCPLLSVQGTCQCYEVRPINCRTYGIPTVIAGAGHVCGFSKFEPGNQYPTVNLEQLQHVLYDLSIRLGGEASGAKRWPLAAVILGDDELAACL